MDIIIGAGLAGLSAAYHLKQQYRIFEKEGEPGGLCRSKNVLGYTFDYAPHILFTRDPYTKSLFEDLLKGNVDKHRRKAFIYLKDTYIEYPFEVNLNGLPKEIIVECIQGVINREKFTPKNFKDWIFTTFGDGVAKYYMVPYNAKIWKYPLEKMDLSWIKDRVPSPSVEEMKLGAEGSLVKDWGPNAEFMYPIEGGIGALPQSLANRVSGVEYDSEIIEVINSNERLKVKCSKEGDIKTLEATRIFSSAPLPELIKMIKDPPEDVQKAAKSLVYNSLICVNLGINRANISDKHWLYFPEDDYIFNRISFPHNFSKKTTPLRKSSILAEVTYRGEKPVDVSKKVVEGLINANILKNESEIEVIDVESFKYAYVIYDLEHDRNVKLIHNYLDTIRIVHIGRFGDWEYHNMDKAILSGKRAVEKN